MKLFGKWDPAEVEVADPSTKGYMNLASKSVIHSGGKHAKQQFKKSEQHIVERLVNKMMRTEKNTGKKLKAYGIVERAFDIVAKKTKENPLSVLAKAIANAGPSRRGCSAQVRRHNCAQSRGYISSEARGHSPHVPDQGRI